MNSAEKIIAIGGAVVALGGGFSGAYYIYSLESGVSFWSWPGAVSLVAVGVGVVMLGVGLFRREERTPGLRQAGGNHSTNYQAGRDIVIGKENNASE